MHRLSLEYAELGVHTSQLIHGFNFAALRSLKLWGCAGVGDLLRDIAISQKIIQLTSLEIVEMDPLTAKNYERDDYTCAFVALPAFLSTFPSVPDVFLMLHEVEWSLVALAATKAHRLRHLVLHQHDVDRAVRDVEFMMTDAPVDLENGWFPTVMAIQD